MTDEQYENIITDIEDKWLDEIDKEVDVYNILTNAVRILEERSS
jgi:hypothetical protein